MAMTVPEPLGDIDAATRLTSLAAYMMHYFETVENEGSTDLSELETEMHQYLREHPIAKPQSNLERHYRLPLPAAQLGEGIALQGPNFGLFFEGNQVTTYLTTEVEERFKPELLRNGGGPFYNYFMRRLVPNLARFPAVIANSNVELNPSGQQGVVEYLVQIPHVITNVSTTHFLARGNRAREGAPLSLLGVKPLKRGTLAGTLDVLRINRFWSQPVPPHRDPTSESQMGWRTAHPALLIVFLVTRPFSIGSTLDVEVADDEEVRDTSSGRVVKGGVIRMRSPIPARDSGATRNSLALYTFGPLPRSAKKAFATEAERRDDAAKRFVKSSISDPVFVPDVSTEGIDELVLGDLPELSSGSYWLQLSVYMTTYDWENIVRPRFLKFSTSCIEGNMREAQKIFYGSSQLSSAEFRAPAPFTFSEAEFDFDFTD